MSGDWIPVTTRIRCLWKSAPGRLGVWSPSDRICFVDWAFLFLCFSIPGRTALRQSGGPVAAGWRRVWSSSCLTPLRLLPEYWGVVATVSCCGGSACVRVVAAALRWSNVGRVCLWRFSNIASSKEPDMKKRLHWNATSWFWEPNPRFELGTPSLRVKCSTAELIRLSTEN